MKLKVLFGMMLSIFSLTIVGCSGGGGETPVPVSTTVSGEASKGPIIGGDVKIFAINADGSIQATPLPTTPATVTTRLPFGNYSAVIGFAGPVKVMVSNGSYKDEATGSTVDFTGKTLSAIVASVAGSARVAVTPYTELAVRKAGAVLTPANISKANVSVANSAGLHEIDIITASPSTDPRYKFALAVISQAAGTGVNDLTNLLTTMANAIDLETGTINSPPVSSTIGAATAAAFNNPTINPTGSIPGILPDTVAEVNVSAPTPVQQINSQVAINTTVKRLDGKPSVNTTVEFLVTTGSGTFSAATAKTDANGVATVNLTSAAEETLVFTVHAHPFTSSSQVIFANLDRPATVTLKADQLQGITKNQGPVTLSAEVTRFGFGLGLGAKLVPPGTIVTFTSTGTGGALSSNTALTNDVGIATVTLNSSTAGNIDVTAKAGTITSSPPVTVQFIDQPVSATLKLSSSGTFPAGITKITSLIGTVSIGPGGVSIKTVPNTNSTTSISADPAVMTLSGVAPLNAVLLPTEVTQVSTIAPDKKVLVPLVSFSGGFDFGEFATIVTDISQGTFPTKNDFTLSGFKAIGVDASGAQVFIPNLIVDFTLSLQ